MRSPLLLSILMSATVGACDQSLTHDVTGAGGTRTASGGWTGIATGGGSGGTVSGAGGLAGSSVALCDTLVAEYQSAFAAANNCQVGAPGQCQQFIDSGLTGCCSTYVNDSAVLGTIANTWRAAGCAPTSLTCNVSCPAALPATCVSTDGGSEGYCSYVPGTGGTSGGATGGISGTGGTLDGGLNVNCAMLASEYAAVLTGAETCTPGAAGQCGQPVPTSISPCPNLEACMVFVTDSSILQIIQQQWNLANCGYMDLPGDCPLVACTPPTSARCVPGDAGGSVCLTSY